VLLAPLDSLSCPPDLRRASAPGIEIDARSGTGSTGRYTSTARIIPSKNWFGASERGLPFSLQVYRRPHQFREVRLLQKHGHGQQAAISSSVPSREVIPRPRKDFMGLRRILFRPNVHGLARAVSFCLPSATQAKTGVRLQDSGGSHP
jgi:hypothetical protein